MIGRMVILSVVQLIEMNQVLGENNEFIHGWCNSGD